MAVVVDVDFNVSGSLKSDLRNVVFDKRSQDQKGKSECESEREVCLCKPLLLNLSLGWCDGYD